MKPTQKRAADTAALMISAGVPFLQCCRAER